jgi:DNA primase (bacterial type)
MARFTSAQLDQAKRTDLEHLLRSRGEELECSGGEYRWVTYDGAGKHDSITIRDNRWFDHRRLIGGDAIGFLQEFDGLSFRGAVAKLLGLRHTDRERSLVLPQNPVPKLQEKKEFILPPRAENQRRLYAYLCKTRCISHEVVTHFVRAGVLYEDAEYHNAVFLAVDEQGKPVGGMKKSTYTNSDFRQTIEGSNTRFAFWHKGTSEKVYVFEAAVDMLSFITLYAQDWQEHSYLVLDGLSSKALLHFLQADESVTEVVLCLDNDEAGIAATESIAAELRKLGHGGVFLLRSEGKDWNEDLLAHCHSRDSPEQELAL